MKNTKLLEFFFHVLSHNMLYFLLSISMRSKIVIERSQIQNYVDTFALRRCCGMAFWIMLYLI